MQESASSPATYHTATTPLPLEASTATATQIMIRFAGILRVEEMRQSDEEEDADVENDKEGNEGTGEGELDTRIDATENKMQVSNGVASDGVEDDVEAVLLT